MEINLIADSSVSSAPAGFTAAIQAAAAIYEQDFPGNYTVNITYGWGTFDNQVDSSLTNSSESLGGSVAGSYNVSYATVKSWLTADASLSDQIAAVASLPASDPNGNNAFYVSSAQEKALGVFTGNTSAVDGSIGFGTNSYDWEGLALCEIGHALGWDTEYYASQPTILDLFRFSSAGTYQWTGGLPAYFSIDGGKTDLANFSTSFDYTLFSNVAANDPFSVSGATSSTLNLTSFDEEVLNVIGFGGQPQQSQPVVADFYGSGTSDLLFKNTGGNFAMWQTNGTTVIGGGNVGSPGAGWNEVGTGVFDTGNKSDILFESTGGSYALWDMNGSSVINVATFGNPGAGFSFVDTGNFDGTGNGDILFENTAGDYAMWQTNGTAVIGGGNVGSPGTGWNEVGIGDFNTGAKSDILFESTGGSYALWDMNGTAVANVVTLGSPGAGWTFEGIGNFDGSGNGDILFENTAGDYAMWETNGTSVVGGGNLGSPGTGWSFAAIGDYNGDGKSDILFQDSSGGSTSYAAWEMNGTALAAVATLGTPGAGWTLQHTA
jgi:hypothetical protein